MKCPLCLGYGCIVHNIEPDYEIHKQQQDIDEVESALKQLEEIKKQAPPATPDSLWDGEEWEDANEEWMFDERWEDVWMTKDIEEYLNNEWKNNYYEGKGEYQ